MIGACGAGGGANEAAERSVAATTRSERTPREASILQQQPSQSEPQSEVELEHETGDTAEADIAEAANQSLTASSDDAEEEAAAVVPTEIDFGHRQGLPFIRNTLGDPEAPVLIVEYSDYQ